MVKPSPLPGPLAQADGSVGVWALIGHEPLSRRHMEAIAFAE
jgi:hypothetical protein